MDLKVQFTKGTVPKKNPAIKSLFLQCSLPIQAPLFLGSLVGEKIPKIKGEVFSIGTFEGVGLKT